ncbi:MAG TPA: DUF1501 domain-containing protein [Gemmataceae bacterium]|nr:DUF1501 domain-containing protein [Gemmataceae bacterium]
MSGRTPVLVSRRQCLQAGAVGCLGLSLPDLLRAEGAGIRPTGDACIVIFLNGGPSHLDMWDMKPGAPAEVRGEFKPIPSSLPGVPLSEHLPRLARRLHLATLVRSVHHSVNNAHAAAVYAALTGHDRGELGGGTKPTDHPAIGSVMGQVRPPAVPVVPYVSMPYVTKEGAGGPPQPGFFGGLLGRTRDPLFVLNDPNAPGFKVPELSPADDVPGPRLGGRRDLLRQVGRPGPSDLDGFQQRAFDLLTSPATQRAFRLDLESAKTRDAYGRNIYGQSVLLARRLIEAGTRVACVSWAPDANATWDTHGQNFTSLKTRLLPPLDAAVSALLDDLAARGLFDRTVVAVMGEFGRSPKVNAAAGRDHWNHCYTLMLVGGGVRQGHVFGASDKIGAAPSRNPVTPADVLATIYHALGISKDTELRDNLDRPFQLVPWGDVIRDVLV